MTDYCHVHSPEISTCSGSDNYDTLATNVLTEKNNLLQVKQISQLSYSSGSSISSQSSLYAAQRPLNTVKMQQILEQFDNFGDKEKTQTNKSSYSSRTQTPPSNQNSLSQYQINNKKINVVKLSDWVVNDLWKDAFELYQAQNEDAEYLEQCSFYLIDNKRIKISFVTYVKRLKELTECSDNCFILALLLFDRLNKKKKLNYSRLNVHKLMAVCLWLSVKFYEDINFTDAYYAQKIAGIPLNELISLQFELLELLNYRLFISPQRFNHFMKLINSLIQSGAVNA